MYDAGLSVPFIASSNVRLAAMRPGSAGISGCFLHSAPYFVMSGLTDVTLYDVSNPVSPKQVGSMPSAQFENEAMNCGERKVVEDPHRPLRDDRRRSLPGLARRPRARQHPGDRRLRAHHRRRQRPDLTRTSARASRDDQHPHRHCIDGTDCRYAYSAGDDSEVAGQGSFSIFDLTRPGRPGPRSTATRATPRHPAVPVRRRRLGRPQVERRRRGLTPPTQATGGSYNLRRPRPPAPARGGQHRRRRRLGP